MFIACQCSLPRRACRGRMRCVVLADAKFYEAQSIYDVERRWFMGALNTLFGFHASVQYNYMNYRRREPCRRQWNHDNSGSGCSSNSSCNNNSRNCSNCSEKQTQ